MPKYCPKCNNVFPDDWDECNECEVELVYEKYYRESSLTSEEIIKADKERKQYEYVQQRQTQWIASQINIPKCPTCQSTNIEKISGADKAVGAVVFGLFSKTARSQFRCKNCGYKW